jgi:hypothetical protein
MELYKIREDKLKMPKRSRYDYVTVTPTSVTVYADGKEYSISQIHSWAKLETYTHVNPEIVNHCISVNGNIVIRCYDEDEMNSIVDELTEQGF